MFQIEYKKDSQTVNLIGKLDSSSSTKAKDVLDKIEDSITINMADLNFICSAGIGTLVNTYSRLKKKGENVNLINLNSHIKKVFEVSCLDTVFDIK